MARDRRKSDRRKQLKTVGVDRREKERRQIDRRFDPRLDVDIWLKEKAEKETVYRRAANFSAGGVLLDHGFPRPVGTRVTLRFALPGSGEPIEVVGEVVAAEVEETKLATRIRFVDLPGEHHIRISQFIDNEATEPDGVVLKRTKRPPE